MPARDRRPYSADWDVLRRLLDGFKQPDARNRAPYFPHKKQGLAMTDAAILHVKLGPVQGFIRQARRTRDLWAGSFLLSWLSGKGHGGGRERRGPGHFARGSG